MMCQYKQNVVQHDKTDEIIYPDVTSFLQFVLDNTDRNLATLDGKNTHHDLGTIVIASKKFSNCSFQQQRIPRVKLEKWLDIKSNNGIKTVQYYSPNIPALTKIVL